MWAQGSGGQQPTDGKIKGRPSARRMWLVGLENLPLTSVSSAGAFADLHSKINLPSAITLTAAAVFADDHARR